MKEDIEEVVEEVAEVGVVVEVEGQTALIVVVREDMGSTLHVGSGIPAVPSRTGTRGWSTTPLRSSVDGCVTAFAMECTSTPPFATNCHKVRGYPLLMWLTLTVHLGHPPMMVIPVHMVVTAAPWLCALSLQPQLHLP